MTRLGALASVEVASVAAPPSLLAVPVGATEQHGPHLPLDTDTVIASALAARLGGGAVIAPPLPYGSSGEHQGFPGTLSIGQEAVQTVLVELVRSATETFDRVLLVCAHGGNAEPVARAVARLRSERRDVRAWSPASVWHGDAHAGHVETSVMLALRPETVALERAAAGNTAPLGSLIAPMRDGGVAAVSANGVLGDPTRASAAAGTELLERAVNALRAFVEEWSS
ncbi:MAG TPA: mycofactocin biosynthesis peptidyl-dipeptidase MftE [Solirubrobacteraceae bacterium]|nr:mycofactocin biosynthesis peptidyl-dipeptidase MftE [Solirubrobacteraceae bacterium]